MNVNQHNNAFKVWQVLTQRAQLNKAITYLELGHEIGIHHRVVRFPLHLIQEYCLEANLPGLTVLVNDRAGNIGSGFKAYGREQREEGVREVLDYKWEDEENPFAFAADGESFDTLVKTVLEEPEERLEVYRKIKSRGIAQQVFRDVLLNAYKGRCAFSQSSMLETLEAAHIVPWSEVDDVDKFNPQNGLLLNVWYHRLFDRDVLFVDEDLVIRLNPKLKRMNLAEIDQQVLDKVVDQKLKRPRHKDFFPDLKFIKLRLESLKV